MFNIIYNNIHIIGYMSINPDWVASVSSQFENPFSQSGADIACMNCQCGYKDVLDTHDTSMQRSLKTLIHKNITPAELQKICDTLWIDIHCDGIQAPSLSGSLEYICIQVRRKMIRRIQDNRIFFQVSHADDLADIW